MGDNKRLSTLGQAGTTLTGAGGVPSYLTQAGAYSRTQMPTNRLYCLRIKQDVIQIQLLMNMMSKHKRGYSRHWPKSSFKSGQYLGGGREGAFNDAEYQSPHQIEIEHYFKHKCKTTKVMVRPKQALAQQAYRTTNAD